MCSNSHIIIARDMSRETVVLKTINMLYDVRLDFDDVILVIENGGYEETYQVSDLFEDNKHMRGLVALLLLDDNYSIKKVGY